MLDNAINKLASILNENPWMAEIAGILPLSALIDFVDVPLKLHVHQLVSGVPLWSWPITPLGSRLLLSKDAPRDVPCLDRFGRSTSLEALDGRYGDQYFVSSPETLRLALGAQNAGVLSNNHENMGGSDLRVQNLQVVFVSRAQPKGRDMSKARWYHQTLGHPSMHSPSFLATAAIGWIALIGCTIGTLLLSLHIAATFLLLMPVTGIFVHLIHGGRPRRLLVNSMSDYDRMVVVSEHSNSADWTVFYGESTLVNSFLNRPLEPTKRVQEASSFQLKVLMFILRLLILAQWAAAIAAAATKDWNSFFICFWVVFCNTTHGFIIPPKGRTGDWVGRCAKMQLHCYKTRVSSRRALLSTLVALNPDTFAEKVGFKGEERATMFAEGMKWVDPILKPSGSRTMWEDGMREALNEVAAGDPEDVPLGSLQKDRAFSAHWNEKYGREFWKSFVSEGIYMATQIKLADDFQTRKTAC
ncbi:hypothetical protein QBC38DRAFT_24757 [Podospora fimiseda]|uniref:Uncharacterized protein n=1 Tax=Podospora fimiseda TaxID=252190 RepID=A0AAN7BJ92_9PEZI|nr:hypothetical protein QBC38DRAFT_24757 [Podospora fimiseda]